MSTFETLAQLSLAFVAFATIVITVRTSTGGKLTPFQLLLTHFFIAVGLMAAGIAALSLALLETYGDTPTVWRISAAASLFAIVGYMPFYMMRRVKIKAPTPPLSILVMVGYLIAAAGLVLTLMDGFWQPSFSIIVAFVLWTLFSSSLIFVNMFEDFIGTALEDD